MKKVIQLEIISDVVCPWCIIGYKHLEAAIAELGIEDQVVIEWQPFELNPDMPQEGENLRDHVARKYDASLEQSDRARANITHLGAEYGFSFNYFEQMKMVNTLDAHVLLAYAKSEGKQHELKLRLFHAFFSEEKDISDRDVLFKELESIGLDPVKGRDYLADNTIRDEVRRQEQFWQQCGVSSVPTVIFDQTNAMSGAQPVESYKQVLSELLVEHASG